MMKMIDKSCWHVVNLLEDVQEGESWAVRENQASQLTPVPTPRRRRVGKF